MDLSEAEAQRFANLGSEAYEMHEVRESLSTMEQGNKINQKTSKGKLSGSGSIGKARPQTNSGSSSKPPSCAGIPKGTLQGTLKKLTPTKGSVSVANIGASTSTDSEMMVPPIQAHET